ncbi:MAG: chromate efflux transporter [Vicinamibacteraceae bacterium]
MPVGVGVERGASNAPEVSFREALRVWVRVAALSFGGPAGQIAVMHRILVEEKRWISERRFLHALNYCMLLPGPEAQQLAIYVGWLLHRTTGGLVAGTLFVVPGFLSILALSILYVGFQQILLVQAVFFGIKAAVLAIVVDAVMRIGRRALAGRQHYALAAGAFVALFMFQVPFPVVILSAGLIGLAHAIPTRHDTLPEGAVGDVGVVDAVAAASRFDHTRPSLARAVRVASIGLCLWLVPTVALNVALGSGHVFSQVATFFSTMAVVTFGGAYAVLAYVAQQGVEHYGWLQPGEMLDGLGMAETTPGPLIQVVQFVAFLAAFREPGSMDPYEAALLASVLAAWVTFVPCFVWIFLGAPYVESLRANWRANAALSSITAAVVGVVLNLSVWFSMHVLFARVESVVIPGGAISIPVWRTLDVPAAALAAGALFALLRRRWGMMATLAMTTGAGMLLYLLVQQ